MNRDQSPSKMRRRDFISRSLLASASLSAGTEALHAAETTTDARPSLGANSKGTLPAGTIGKLSISRLISGGNLLSGWCHQRDLLFVRNLAEAYLTEQKQFDTLQMAEAHGVNSIVLDMMQIGILRKYKQQRGGKIQMIASVRQDWGDWGNPRFENLKTQIKQTIDLGPEALFIHGGYADRLVESGRRERIELLGQAIQFIRDQKIPAGLGAHALEVLKETSQLGIQPDYYVKTFHHDQYWSATPRDRRKPFSVDGRRYLDHNEFHDNIFCLDPEATAEFMLDKKVPWIAFKVLAAGAIQPKSGFKYAFENGADFIAVGMFDFEVAEDVQTARDILKNVQRERPWSTPGPAAA
jgi:hypothetical protein